MILQGLSNNESILFKKFKILRTSLLLDSLKNRNDTLREFEETAREIDRIKRNIYEELLASKTYTTTTLEEEKERLTDLISFIEKRVVERNEFIDDYLKVTSSFLDDLDAVSMEDDLLSLKDRLGCINDYLSNEERIKEINHSLISKKKELEEKYENKANNELINSKLEDTLVDEFNKFVTKNEYYSGLDYTDIDSELERINSELKEKHDVMDTFVSSYEALKSAGISGSEREEYLSYVQDTRREFYDILEKKYVLSLYKLVLDKEDDYDRLYEKRSKIDNIFTERERARKELGIDSRDELEYFSNLCKEQYSVIRAQKFNLESIERLIMEISNLESELERIEEFNNNQNILDLLNEYSVEKVKPIKLDLPEEKKIFDEVITKNSDGTPKPSNMVVRVDIPKIKNIKTASDTAKLVMKKVVIVLEPKKFNSSKKEKIKKDELELAKRIEKEKSDELQEKIDKKNDNNDLDIFVDNGAAEVIFKVDDEISKDSSDESNDKLDSIFLDDSNVLASKMDIFTDDEIFFDDNKKKSTTNTKVSDTNKDERKRRMDLDLFSSKDPFLDDNDYEVNGSEDGDNGSILPSIKRIGSVKPNNMLSKIEDVAKQNDDIILPTLGLSNTEKVDVPIVSENYIN